jgi:hypothetical protein
MLKKVCKSLPVGICARARNVCDATATPKMMGAKIAPSTATGQDEVCSNVKQECLENHASNPPTATTPIRAKTRQQHQLQKQTSLFHQWGTVPKALRTTW